MLGESPGNLLSFVFTQRNKHKSEAIQAIKYNPKISSIQFLYYIF